MTNMKISLIFACYNVSQYLKDLYQLLITQSYQNIEIIFVEDCSTDNTKEILRGFTDSRVKLIENSHNQGAAISRNIGITYATGEYIWFPDPDDLFDVNLISEAASIISQYEPDMLLCGMREEYEINGILEYTKDITSTYSGEIKIQNENISDVLVNLEETFLFGYTNNKFYKSSIILQNNIKNKPLALKEDFEFNIQFFKLINDFYILNKPYYFYKKRNNGSLTNKFVKEYFDIHMTTLFQFKALIESKYGMNRNVEILLVNRFVRYFLSAVERNTNKASNLTFSTQKEWVESVLSDSKYGYFLERLELITGKMKLIKPLFSTKFSWLLVILGNVMRYFKTNLPIIFARLK
ncbi:glycosyltransferase family 2 protein [Actinobacillus equuli subsp. equuli]|uniref:glycosyltransferase family 2 protein n=1 Tax=Actinobacillus equuli TaxID=718 RepID=UPI002442845F|nr:glycosyltransferase family 2 protein [Actinobacillus equuli]WGE54970.1 glycosyltransferase family 2 protein [Actinobacillus equuli subsp. equuli]